MADLRSFPRENDDFLTFEGVLFNGQPSDEFEVAIVREDVGRPITVWTPFPGPKTPTVPGIYQVFIRQGGAVTELQSIRIY